MVLNLQRKGGCWSLSSSKDRLWFTIKKEKIAHVVRQSATVPQDLQLFVTFSSNNYKFIIFPQISFYILSCCISLIFVLYLYSFVSSIHNPNDSFVTFTLCFWVSHATTTRPLWFFYKEIFPIHIGQPLALKLYNYLYYVPLNANILDIHTTFTA